MRWILFPLLWLTACTTPNGKADTAGNPPVDADGDGVNGPEDCDDENPLINPSATEICDGIDNDCDQVIDDADTNLDRSGLPTVFADNDGDQFGDPNRSGTFCVVPEGWIDDSLDCNDINAQINPTALEVCDGIDNDCDELADEADDSLDVSSTQTVWQDADGDQYGDPTTSHAVCTLSATDVGNPDDCDDNNPDVNPDATEICKDKLDNNCDGSADPCLFADGSLANADARYYGVFPGEGTGHGVTAAGDVDGDGRADLLLFGLADGPGQISVTSGAPSGDVATNTLSATIRGKDSRDFFGYAAAGMGDLNQDGYEDVAIGAFGDNSGATMAGALYIYNGPLVGNLDRSDAQASLLGAQVHELAGLAFISLGDVTGDGSVDLLIGAPGMDPDGAGGAYIAAGPFTGQQSLKQAVTVFQGENANDNVGYSFAAADVNGDGIQDMVLGAPLFDYLNGYGCAYLVYGPALNTYDLALADVQFSATSQFDGAGMAVAADDVDHDGYADVWVTSPFDSALADQAGTIYLQHGPIAGDMSLGAADTQFDGPNADDNAGVSISIGEVNGDGETDLLVGASGVHAYGGYDGGAWLVLGPFGAGNHNLADADRRWIAESAADLAGAAVAMPGDMDGDGLGELVIGAYSFDGKGSSSGGAAYVYYGVGL